MTVRMIAIGLAGGIAFLAGCRSPQPPPPPLLVQTPAPVAIKETQPPAIVPRKRTAEQIQLLQDFALRESPQIHATIQMLRAEMTADAAPRKHGADHGGGDPGTAAGRPRRRLTCGIPMTRPASCR